MKEKSKNAVKNRETKCIKDTVSEVGPKCQVLQICYLHRSLVYVCGLCVNVLKWPN